MKYRESQGTCGAPVRSGIHLQDAPTHRGMGGCGYVRNMAADTGLTVREVVTTLEEGMGEGGQHVLCIPMPDLEYKKLLLFVEQTGLTIPEVLRALVHEAVEVRLLPNRLRPIEAFAT